jgi:hypothetical protein
MQNAKCNMQHAQCVFYPINVFHATKAVAATRACFLLLNGNPLLTPRLTYV